MACCNGGNSEQAKKDAAISAMLAEDGKKQDAEVKLLLLGRWLCVRTAAVL